MKIQYTTTLLHGEEYECRLHIDFKVHRDFDWLHITHAVQECFHTMHKKHEIAIIRTGVVADIKYISCILDLMWYPALMNDLKLFYRQMEIDNNKYISSNE